MSDDIEELKAAVEALTAKNRELLGEVKMAKAKARGSDINPEDYAALQNELEATKAALDKTAKDSGKQLETLNKALAEKDGALQSYLIDNGLNDAMLKAGIRPEVMGVVKARLKAEAKLVAENGQYSALFGDKPLVEGVTAWASSDEGKHFVAAPANSGGGASGSQAGNGGNPAPKGNLGGDRSQRANAIRNMFPELS
jgi:hypothetical protein